MFDRDHQADAAPASKDPQVAPHPSAPADALRALRAGGNRAVARLMKQGPDTPDGTAVAARIAAHRGGGRPLADGVRSEFENGYGADLGDVRIHDDAESTALADALHARAFTTGRDVFFGADGYDPHSSTGAHVLAHELAHTLQDGTGTHAYATVTDPGDPAEREAEQAARTVLAGGVAHLPGTDAAGAGRLVLRRAPGGGDLSERDLLLTVMFGGDSVSWDFPIAELDPGLVANLRADPARVPAIEAQIGAALRDDAGPVHESQTYLQSPPVADDLRRDLAGWPATRALPLFSGRIAARAAAVRATRLRWPLEQSLAASGTLWPGDIDWAQEVAVLRGHSPGPDRTVIDAARNDRFALALAVLDAEARTGPPPAPGLSPHPDLLGPIIFARYAATDPAPSELQTTEMTRTHSEAFLAQWLPTIRDARLIPDGFDLAAFEPTDELDQLRRELVNRYIDVAAPRTMEKYLLDRWASGSGSPEQFIRTADINALRHDLIEHLGKDFMRWAVTQPGFRGAFWSDVGQRAAYSALKTLVLAGRALQAFHGSLADRFSSVGADELSVEEFAIAQDPYGYSQKIAAVAAATTALTQHLKPGELLEHGLLGWYQAIAATWSAGGEDARGVAGLLAVFQGLGGLKSAIEAQQTASRTHIALRLDTSFEAIAAVIRNEARAADEFIQTKWIPMLKVVALEQITRNRDEMKEHIANWPKYRAEAVAKFKICGHFLDDLITRLQSGDVESATMGTQVLTPAELPALIQARDFMKGEAAKLESDEEAEAKKDDMKEAVAGFEKVRKRILSGDYKPVDYSKAVYDEARARLGIAGYDDWVTMGQALDRWAIVPQNPFLGYAIARWQWEEHVKQLDDEFLLFIGLGLLTLASLVVPGAAGVVLTAIDVAAGIAQGVKGVSDAYALVDLAELDPTGAIGGVTIEQARAALHTAWIGLGINIVLVGGLGAVWAAMKLAGRGAGKIPMELERLAALAKVNPVAAEKMMAQVKDLVKLEELLAATGDSMLLERMLAKTGDVWHLEYALMFGEPRKIAELMELAGDAGKLSKVLDHVPDAITAERLLRMTDDAEGLSLLLRSADNAGIAEALLKWTNPRMADRLLGLAGGEQGGLLTLSTSGLSPETAAALLPRCDSAAELAALVKRMDKGPEQIAGLLDKHPPGELKGLLDRGIRPSEVEMGVGTPALGAQPTFPANTIPMPDASREILRQYGLADHPLLQTIQPHELGRIRTLADGGGLSKKVPAEVRQKAAEWAANGATSPGNFVDRWEFFKTRVDDVALTLDPALYRNQNLKVVAARQLTDDVTLLNTVFTSRAQSMRELGGIGWADLGAPAGADLVKGNATRLSFGSEANAAYHPVKHRAELPLSERAAPDAAFDAQASAYLASARRTVAEGALASAETSEGATRMVFKRTTEGVEMTAMVITRDQYALIASLTGKAIR
ncbi:DUF4157 domain-containing protein [Krasilnikovia sp. M28-CT-15]|uniref:eCIS core domain-containing protein n=1 Tax=Krasilnikovia sp. M28-CT-15 TaxID=3373540 RepID=UPI00387623DA